MYLDFVLLTHHKACALFITSFHQSRVFGFPATCERSRGSNRVSLFDNGAALLSRSDNKSSLLELLAVLEHTCTTSSFKYEFRDRRRQFRAERGCSNPMLRCTRRIVPM